MRDGGAPVQSRLLAPRAHKTQSDLHLWEVLGACAQSRQHRNPAREEGESQ